MESENEFFKSLKSVIILLIKNWETGYEDLLPTYKIYDEGAWNASPIDEKIKHLKEVESCVTVDSPIRKHFESYPHPYTRERFANLDACLQRYQADLHIAR